MGVVFSLLRNLKTIISTLKQLDADFKPVLARIKSSPGIPVPNPTTSFWLLPPHELHNVQSPKLPDTADIVIIGSGITGVIAARTLLKQHPKLRVVICDARDVCSGATGRNGGHCKAPAYEDGEYRKLKKKYGRDGAGRIEAFRLAHLRELMRVIEEEGCADESEGRVVEGTDVYFTEETAEEAKEMLEEWKEEIPEMTAGWRWVSKEEAKETLLIKTATGAAIGPAGALWPYRLITAILSRLVSEHPSLSLESNTPITAIESFNNSYKLTTPRGIISTRTILHATNAHASHLLPELREKVIPVRAQMSAQSPPKGIKQGADRSWTFIYSHGYDYLTQRPSNPTSSVGGGDEMMFGGGWAQTGNSGYDEIGVASDDGINMFAASYLTGVLPYIFSGSQSGWKGVEVKNMWSGSIAISVDLKPWVGPIPQSVATRKTPTKAYVTDKMAAREKEGVLVPGEFVCGAYSGEGMDHALGCAIAVSKMMTSATSIASSRTNNTFVDSSMALLKPGEPGWSDPESKVEDWFPAEMLFTEDRWKRTDVMDLVELL